MLTSGSPAPDIALQDSDGRAVRLADYQGVDNVLLYFMRSTACAVCNQHVKDLVSKEDEFSAAHVRVLVAVPEGPAEASAWKTKRHLPYAVVTGREGTPHEALGLTRKVFGSVQQSGSVLIDRGGVVRHAHAATLPLTSYDKKGIAAAVAALSGGTR